MVKKVRVLPLGGLGEIGKNMTVFEMDNRAIIVDTGIMFPANDMFGVDYIIPDFTYLQSRDDLRIEGILYTHGHEDHIGAICHVLEAFPNVPIFATRLTAGLIDVKLREKDMVSAAPIRIFEAGDLLEVGPFTVESFHVCHSIPDCVGFAINTPFGLIVHTGDYKFDNTPIDNKPPDYARLAEYSRRGVKLLMADSTNATTEGWTPSESVISEAFDRVFRKAKGRIIVATFASLISRIQQVADVAQRYGRRMAIAGHSMNRNVDIARDLGMLNIPDRMLVDLNQIDLLPPHEVIVMATGAQGEPSSVLTRMAAGRYRVEVTKGDTIIISAHTIPGNEEMVSRRINDLFRRGANVIYDPLEAVHVSGHGNREDMRMMINLTRPEYFLPIHGELRHLHAHAQLARESGIRGENIMVVENGHVIELDKHGVQIAERVPGGYVFVDGNSVGDVGRAVLRDREILAQDGFVIVVMNVDARTNQLMQDPEIISRGFVYMRDASELIEQIRASAVRLSKDNRKASADALRREVEDGLAAMIYTETRRRPMIFCVVNRV